MGDTMNLFLCLLFAFNGIGYIWRGKKDDNIIMLVCSLIWMFASGISFCNWLLDLAAK